jgi:hypothetical protein
MKFEVHSLLTAQPNGDVSKGFTREQFERCGIAPSPFPTPSSSHLRVRMSSVLWLRWRHTDFDETIRQTYAAFDTTCMR